MEAADRISKLVEEYFGDVKAVCSPDYWYCEDDNMISWSFVATEQFDKMFTKMYEEELNCSGFNIFILSVFHEYGHKMTMSTFSKKARREYLRDVWHLSGEAKEVNQYLYMHLPLEWAASSWAAAYLNRNREKVLKWYDEVIVPAWDKLLEDKDALADYLNEMLEIDDEEEEE